MDISQNVFARQDEDVDGAIPSEAKTTLMCFSMACSDKPKHVVDRVAHSNKIFLPESMLYKYKQEQFPLYFKLTHPEYGVSTVCGVEEFTGPPGCFVVPHRIMEHLLICDGQNIDVQICHPLKGNYIKLKPRKTAFIELSNPKAVLERFMSKDYPIISVGDTLSINHLNTIYHIDVVECKPGNSIDILNTDVNLDFDTPADYVEPPKITKEVQEQTTDNLPKITGVNKKIAFVNDASVASNQAAIASNDVSSARNTKLNSFKTIKTGLFVPFSGAGNKLGSS